MVGRNVREGITRQGRNTAAVHKNLQNMITGIRRDGESPVGAKKTPAAESVIDPPTPSTEEVMEKVLMAKEALMV